MSFDIGQRIICIYDWKHQASGIQCPVKHGIYTVRAHCPCADTPAILLQEIINSIIVTFHITGAHGEPSFACKHFRPLFDISELESLLILEKESA